MLLDLPSGSSEDIQVRSLGQLMVSFAQYKLGSTVLEVRMHVMSCGQVHGISAIAGRTNMLSNSLATVHYSIHYVKVCRHVARPASCMRTHL